MTDTTKAVDALMRELGYHPTHAGDFPDVRRAIKRALADSHNAALLAAIDRVAFHGGTVDTESDIRSLMIDGDTATGEQR
jgi:hypothetical protein